MRHVYTTHYLKPEKKIGIYQDGWYVCAADSYIEAEQIIRRFEREDKERQAQREQPENNGR